MKNSIKSWGIGAVFLLLVFSLISALKVSGAEKDSDLDGITDPEDKYPYDFDNDGMTDIWEKKNGLQYDKNDAGEDPDKDGLSNIQEYLSGTNPNTVNKEMGLSPQSNKLTYIMIVAGALVLILFIVLLTGKLAKLRKTPKPIV